MNNWDHIRYFLAVAKHGSLTKASAALNVNHSTITRRINTFEQLHGVRLFRKTPKGYDLTDVGVDLLSTAKEMNEAGDRFFRQMKGLDKNLSGQISLTMPHDIYEMCLYKGVNSFLEQHKDISINLLVAKGIKNMATQEADIAVRLTASPPDYLVGTEIVKLGYALYQGTTMQESGTTSIITWEGEQKIPSWAESFKNPEIRLRVDDLLSMYTAVKSGIGIARMPCYLPNLINSDLVIQLKTPAPQSSWGVWVLNHIDLRNTARIRKCKDHLIQELKDHKHLFELEFHEKENNDHKIIMDTHI